MALKERHKVSWHVQDLGKLDVSRVLEVAKWLKNNAVKPRDIARRTVSKRLFNRHIAAKLALKAAEGDVSAIREWMDRSEGKVADKLITVDLNEAIRQLEAGRQRVLAHRQPQDVVVDGSTIESETDSTALTVLESKTST